MQQTKFSNFSEKKFHKELLILSEKLKGKEHFCFTKMADGEFRILINNHIDLRTKCNGEFKFDPNDQTDLGKREDLISAFMYEDDGYYLGVGCPCCMGKKAHDWMAANSRKQSGNLTFANIMVNSNFPLYQKHVLPQFQNYDIVIVCNKRANIENLPFDVQKDFRIGTNAWLEDYGLIDDVKDYISANKVKDHLFLFCAGPFGNMLGHELWKFSKENTYLDIGSTIDPMLFGDNGMTRGYLRGEATLKKSCTWSYDGS